MNSGIKFRVLTIMLSAVVSLMVGIGFWPTQVSIAAPPYKIGVIQPMTGVYGNYGNSTYEAIKIAAEEINAAGGIRGRKIELFIRDTKAKPDVGVRETKDLILRVGVDAIIGPISSAVNLAVIEVTREYKMLHFDSLASSEQASLLRIHPYYFQLFSNTYMEAVGVAKYVAGRKDVKNYVTLAADYEWGHSTVGIVEPAIAKDRPDIKLLKKFWPKLGEVDFTSYITAILAEKPDVCVAWIAGSDFLNFVKQAKGYGFFEKVPYVTLLHEDDLYGLGSELPEGMIIYSRAPFYGINNPKHTAFQKKFIDRTGYPGAMYAIHGYDGVMLIAEAIKRAGSFDKDAIAKQISGGTFDLLRGKLTWRPIDHMPNIPIYFSTTFFDKERGYCIGKDVTVVPGGILMRTPEEIKKIRAEKGIVFKPWHEK